MSLGLEFYLLHVFRTRILLARMFFCVASDSSPPQKALHDPGQTVAEAPGNESLEGELLTNSTGVLMHVPESMGTVLYLH